MKRRVEVASDRRTKGPRGSRASEGESNHAADAPLSARLAAVGFA